MSSRSQRPHDFETLAPDPGAAGANRTVLQTHDLHKVYRIGEVDVAALRGIDMQVTQGEFVAVMGPSGSGKSTLLHLLGGLDRPTRGEVVLAGTPMSTLDDDALSVLRRRKIGFVFQSYNLVPMLTAEENVTLPLLVDGRDPDQAHERMEALMHMVLLEDRKDHKPDQLSGGQQQRVAIARALISDPELVLADEPTGNLDSQSGTVVLDLLRRVRGGTGTTVVMVTHDPRASSYADRVVFLKDGVVVDHARNVGDGSDTARIAKRLAALEEL